MAKKKQPVVIHKETHLLHLDLASGEKTAEGFEGVDLFAPSAKHKWDLLQPWPLKENSCARLRCSHFIEHIPMVFVAPGEVSSMPGPGRKDALLWFFDEAYRVLVPGGTMEVIWPCLQTVRAFQDPTHRRYIPQEMCFYLNKEWREHPEIRLGHYGVYCNFSFQVGRTMPNHEGVRAVEVQAARGTELWNTSFDFVANLTSLKK
jgi:predicted SAM-dependent methyltransferase